MMARVSRNRLGEARGAVLHADQRAHPRSVLRLSDKLPGTGHTHEAVAAVKLVHFLGEGFQRLGDGGLGLGKFLGLALACFTGLFQNILQLFGAQGFLGGKESPRCPLIPWLITTGAGAWSSGGQDQIHPDRRLGDHDVAEVFGLLDIQFTGESFPARRGRWPPLRCDWRRRQTIR